MKPSPALPWALAILDEGLRLYRRNFLRLALVASTLLVPAALLGLALSAFVTTQLGGAWSILSAVFLPVLLYPLYLYAYFALSRASSMILDGNNVNLRSVLRINPVRAVGMGCYNIVFTAVSSIFSSVVVSSVACPILYASTLSAGVLGSVGGTGTLGAIGAVLIVLFGLIMLVSLLLFGSVIASQVYAVQAWAIERRPFSAAMSRSIDLLTFRLGRSFLVFVGAGAISSTIWIAFVGALLVGGQSLFSLLDLDLAPGAGEALTLAATTASLVILLPPLPIWMAMLHRALARERDGVDLQRTIESWHSSTGAHRSA